MKEYQHKKTKELINKLKPFYLIYKTIEDNYWKEIHRLETEMAKITKIEDIEFYFCDNELAGIGNAKRDMELIHYNELEEIKDEKI